MSRTVGFSCATDPQMLMVDVTGQDERRGWPPSYPRSTEVCCQSATVLGLLHIL